MQTAYEHHDQATTLGGALRLCGGVSECARIPSGWTSAALALYSAFPYVNVLFVLILISSQSSPWDTRPGKCDADGPAMNAKKLNAKTLNVECWLPITSGTLMRIARDRWMHMGPALGSE